MAEPPRQGGIADKKYDHEYVVNHTNVLETAVKNIDVGIQSRRQTIAQLQSEIDSLTVVRNGHVSALTSIRVALT